jgi:hypothetical protein
VPDGSSEGVATRIAGLSILKGLLLYGATLAFVGFYAYFVEEIWAANTGTPPTFDAAMVSAAAALAGVLGAAFALVIGVPTDESEVNQSLTQATGTGNGNHKPGRARLWLWRLLSLEPTDKAGASWPLTFGIWTYAVVASSVALTYLINQAETPEAVRALAVAFGGYVVAFVTMAYGVATKSN